MYRVAHCHNANAMCTWSCLGTQIKQLGLLDNVHSLPHPFDEEG